jgi:acetyltransferase-like isoleucine patch superfamily enzyme
LYYFVRYRCSVSWSASVQFSPCITFGEGTVVKSFAVIQTHTGRITIGRKCAISSFDHLSTDDGDIVIGDYVRLAPSVTIIGGTKEHFRKDMLIMDQPPSAKKGIHIGDDVLLGAGSVVLPGCTIFQGAVIGAGSVVTEDVPPYAIVAGSPARTIGERK